MNESQHLTEADVASIVHATAAPDDVQDWLSHLEDCETCSQSYQSRIDATLVDRRLRDAMSEDDPYSDEMGFKQLSHWIKEGLAPQCDRQHSIRMKIPSEIGQYELIRMIGCGGMGVVLEARQRWLNRKVAIKLLRSDRGIDQNSLQQFTREFEAVGRLNHPGIVRAIDAGCSHGHAYLVMELVDGLDLEKVRRCHGVLSEANTIEIAIGAAEALSHAHQNGVIHRDVKPSNLMLARDVDGSGVKVRLMDLGLGQVESAVTPDSPVMLGAGTKGFRSPEQSFEADGTSLSRDCVDQRADIYSLGATILSLSTELRHHQWTSAIASGSTQLSTGLRELSAAMLSLSPSDRPDTMLQVADELRKLRGTTPRANLTGLLASAQTKYKNDLPDEDYSWSVLTERFISQTETLPRPPTKRPGFSRASRLSVVVASLTVVLLLGIVWKVVWDSVSISTPTASLSNQQQTAEPEDAENIGSTKAGAIDSATDSQAVPLSQQIAYEVVRLGGVWESISKTGHSSEYDSVDSFPDFPVRIDWIMLPHSEADDETLELISRLRQLKGIVLSYTNVTDEGVKKLTQCKSLNKVYLYETAVTDESVEALATLPNLTTLVISATEITNRSIKSLENCDSLTRLTIKGTRADRDCLTSIGTLENLEYLDLREINLNGADLSPLLSLKRLKDIDLSYTDLDAEAMATLMALPRLHKITTNSEQISASAAKTLMKQHPQVVIFRDPTE